VRWLVAEYREAAPEALAKSLQSAEDIERKLGGAERP
jgi:hypothetical protein